MYCMYFTDAIPIEPLCWEEQLNSRQVKLLKQSKHTMPTKVPTQSGEIHPVVFHEKKSVEEMLKKQKVGFHLSSCHLPDLKRTKKVPEKYLSGGKGRKKMMAHKKSPLNNQLELKGSGLKNFNYTNTFVNGNWKLPEQLDVGAKFHDLRYKGKDFCNQAKDSRLHSHCSPIDISRVEDTQMERKTLCGTNQYVEIPVSLPNPALTDESCSIISDGRDLNSEIISFDKKSDQFNKSSSGTKSAENDVQDKSLEDTDEQRVRKSVNQVTVPVGITDDDFELRKKECYTGAGYSTPRESRMSRQSSRLTYTPSTPPVFLSNDIPEFPKGVSPSKALLELRQTFCENIRKETEQLEFDLQELCLKKQLHDRNSTK